MHRGTSEYMTRAEISTKLATQKIVLAQIDPFSFCNAGCWFCPVRYTPNPREAVKHMPPELLEKVIADLRAEKCEGGLVAPEFHFIYTAHYNEVLLYRHFEAMVDIFRRYGMKTYVLSNGIPLSRQRTDFIRQNTDVVVGLCLNVPAFERDLWSRRSGMKADSFDRLIDNIGYAESQLADLAKTQMFTVQINGATEFTFHDRGGWVTKGANFPADMNLDRAKGELATQTRLCSELFPTLNVTPMPSPIDRAGYLADAGVISNQVAIDERLKGDATKVVGCGNGREVGGRPFGWLHVNAGGDTFLCCNDYAFAHVFGNLTAHSLRDVWLTERHAEVIEKAFDGICRRCASSIWT